ncbi:MAG: hypothetical protein M3Z09_08790, partial [Acidobacteriota bacterium]|nr:hypothetical protein [Acidobacteriota bacterium]
PQLMDVPFPSYWKLENRKWVWYIYQDPNRMTPFGKANGKSQGMGSDPSQAFASAPDVAAILNGVKADKNTVTIAKTVGAGEVVTISNRLPGKVSLAFDAEEYPGLKVALDKKDLQAGESARLTIETAAAKEYVNRVVRVMVQPSNQALDVMVKFQ